MADIHKETDSLEEVDVAADKLWGAQTQRSPQHFGTGKDLIPRGMIDAFLKKAAEIAKLTGLPFVSGPNKLTVQGAHDALVQLSGSFRTLAVSLYRIANDIGLMSWGPRAGFAELAIPANEPGSWIMTGRRTNFRKFLITGTKPNLKKIKEYVDQSLMLVTALSPVIGYDKAPKIAHLALDNDFTLKVAASELGFVTETEFDRVVDPAKMVKPYVAAAN